MTTCIAKTTFFLLLTYFVFALSISIALAEEQDSGFARLALTEVDTRYRLISHRHSSGFFPVTEKLSLGLDERPNPASSGDLSPNFRKHGRYWLYTTVVNSTDNPDWVLHISNFGYRPPTLLLSSEDGKLLKKFDYSQIDINAIGRSIQLELQPGKHYFLVVELESDVPVWRPYIALMGDRYYQSWKTRIDFAFKLPIGMTSGLILIALVCWLFIGDKVLFWGGISSDNVRGFVKGIVGEGVPGEL